MEFSRQEYWSGLPFPSPGDLPNWRIESVCPALQVDSLLSEPVGKPTRCCCCCCCCYCCYVDSVVSDSVRPHRRQPTRLPRPWDSPGKNTGVGCHCLLCPQDEYTKINAFIWTANNQSKNMNYLLIVRFSSVTQSCPTLCDPMNRSMPGLPAHHQLPGFTQTHVHCVSDAIQPSHPLSFPSPPALNPSQHQSLFQWVSSSHQMAKVLEFQLQHQSFQWTLRTDLL